MTTPHTNPASAAPLDLEAIKARAAAATEGPWEWGNPTIGQHWSRPEPWAEVVNADVACGSYCYGGSVRPIESDADGQFIAHAREDIPALVAEVDELRRRLDAVLKLHHAVDCEPSETICAGCSTLRGAGSSARYFPYTEYPCPTVLAARGEQR